MTCPECGNDDSEVIDSDTDGDEFECQVCGNQWWEDEQPYEIAN